MHRVGILLTLAARYHSTQAWAG